MSTILVIQVAVARRAYASAGDPLYTQVKYHYVASSEENPACVVEPGTPVDVGKIVGSFRLAPPSIPHHPR